MTLPESVNQSVTIQMIDGRLIATLGTEVSEESLINFRSRLLDDVKESGAREVIIDASGISIMDSFEFNEIARTLEMVKILGARTVLVGLNPGVISSLVYLDVPIEHISTAINLRLAIRLLEEGA